MTMSVTNFSTPILNLAHSQRSENLNNLEQVVIRLEEQLQGMSLTNRQLFEELGFHTQVFNLKSKLEKRRCAR